MYSKQYNTAYATVQLGHVCIQNSAVCIQNSTTRMLLTEKNKHSVLEYASNAIDKTPLTKSSRETQTLSTSKT